MSLALAGPGVNLSNVTALYRFTSTLGTSLFGEHLKRPLLESIYSECFLLVQFGDKDGS